MSSKNHTDILLEEIGYFLHDDDLYEVVSRTKDHIVIKALEVEVEGVDIPVPVGFHIARIMGRILGRVMPYGKMTMEILNIRRDNPKDDKITLEFDITSDYKKLRYKGMIEVVRTWNDNGGLM
jgi:hypothetical protein